MTGEEPRDQPESGSSGGSTPRTVRGADLARAALETARARNAARRTAGPHRSAGSTRSDPPAGGADTDGAENRSGDAGSSSRAPASRSSAIQRRGTASLRRTRWSGAGPDRARDPLALGSALDGWVRSHGSAQDLARAVLFGRWAEIVGPDIAEHAAPVSLVDGDLLVQAESTAWATQLRLLAPTLVQRINGRAGRGTVARIRFQGPTGPSWRFGNRSVPGRGQRDTYG